MATFFKYAERNADAYVNWAEIGRNMSDMFLEYERVREEKRNALDEGLRQELNKLQDAPTGDFKSANDWTLGYANDASQMLLTYSRLLRSGRMNMRDYTIAVQNLSDDTASVFGTMKNIQAVAAEKAKRYQDNESQDLEAWLMEQVEGLSQFRNFKPIFNPVTGHVTLGKTKKEVVDGKEIDVIDKSAQMSVNQLNNYLNIKADKYNYQDALNTEVKDLGTYKFSGELQRIKGAYGLLSISDITDPTQRAKLSDEDNAALDPFFQYEENLLSSMLTNEYHVSSILTNELKGNPKTGNKYTFSFDKDDFGKDDVIYIESDGSVVRPKLTEEQVGQAKDFLRTQFRNRIDQETQVRTITEPQKPQPTQWQYEAGKGNKVLKDASNFLGYLYYGDKTQQEAAINYFKNRKGVINVERTDDGVVINTTTGRNEYSFKDVNGQPIPWKEWVGSASGIIGNDVTIDDVIKFTRNQSNTGFKEHGMKFSGEQLTMSPSDIQLAIDNRVKKAFESLDKTATDKNDIVEQARMFISEVPGLQGYTISAPGMFESQMKIMKDNKEISRINVGSSKWAEQLKNIVEVLALQNADNTNVTLMAEGFNLRRTGDGGDGGGIGARLMEFKLAAESAQD
jgi:hypothetical protein